MGAMSTLRRLDKRRAVFENISKRRLFKRRLGVALVDAAADGDTGKVAELLSKGARVDTSIGQHWPALVVAAMFGHTEVCKLLLRMGKANVNETTPEGFTPLLAVAQEGHTRVHQNSKKFSKSHGLLIYFVPTCI